MPLFKWKQLYSLILAAGVLVFGAIFIPHLLSPKPLLPACEEQSPAREELPADVNEFLKLSMMDLNEAAAEELTGLPGIGEKLAERIVGYREEHGPFRSWEEVAAVRGIGKHKLALVRREAFLGP